MSSKRGKKKTNQEVERLNKIEEGRLNNFPWKPEFADIITEEQWNGSSGTKPISASQRNFIYNNYQTLLNGYDNSSKFIDNKGKPMSLSKAKMFHIQHIQNRTNRNYSMSSKQKEVTSELTENYGDRITQLENTIRRDIPDSSNYFTDIVDDVENLRENYNEENRRKLLTSMMLFIDDMAINRRASKQTYQMIVDYYDEILEAIERKEGIYEEPYIRKKLEEGTPEEVKKLIRDRMYMVSLTHEERFREERRIEEEEKQDQPIPIPEINSTKIKSNISTNTMNQLPEGSQVQTMTEVESNIATNNIFADTVQQIIENEGKPLLTPIKNEAVNVISGALGSVVQTATGSETLGNIASGALNSYLNEDTATIRSESGSTVEQTIRSGGSVDEATIRSESELQSESGISMESGATPIVQSTEQSTEQMVPQTQPNQMAPSNQIPGSFYSNPIHKYALNVYFGSSTAPQWDMELFRGLATDPEFKDISGKKMYFLGISRKIVEKYSTDILVDSLRYNENSSPEEVLREHHEILQLHMSRINNRKGSSSGTVTMRLKDLAAYRNLISTSQDQGPTVSQPITPENTTNILPPAQGYSGMNGSSINIPDKPKVLNKAILNSLTPIEQRWKAPGVIPVKDRKIFGSVKNIIVDKKAARHLDSRIDRPGKPEPSNLVTDKIQTAPIKGQRVKFMGKDCYSMKN